jgi:subtilisin family serine protease
MERTTKRAQRLLVLATSALGLTLALGLALAGGVGAGSASGYDASRLLVNEPVTVSRQPQANGGTVNVVVRLRGAPLAVAMGPNWKQTGGTMNAAKQRAYVARLNRQQASLLSRIEALGGTKLGALTKALNAVVVKIDSAKLDNLSELTNVSSVREIENYRLDLTETVPHIGAAAVQGTGVDGDGVVVGVIDSGIDYTHVAFGGAGTTAAYDAAYGANTQDPANKSRDGLFPTAKVIDGFDFVGENWPFDGPDANTTADLEPDDDPIDCGAKPTTQPAPQPAICAGGHGTHVSDIIAGEQRGAPNPNGPGVAPAARIVLLKACSSVSTACSGVALLQAIERAFDPNGDGDTADAVEIINMSLGSPYGQREDDLGLASTNAVNGGIVVVASAGNSSDRPYIVGSPSSTPEVISVAQSHVPSAKMYLIDTPTADAGGIHQPWSAPPADQSAPLEYDTTSPAGGPSRLGCSDAAGAPPAGWGAGAPHAGKILLMDRGTCAVSMKVHNASNAGAVGAIIANNVTGGSGPYEQPPSFSFGGGADADNIPAYTVTLAEGVSLRAADGTNATISLAGALSLVNHIVQSSSRGPTHSFNTIKPDITAPGASLSAEVGTGTGNTAFGGTSGSAPMVAGSAALLLDKYDLARTPAEVKSLLMNTAETDHFLNPRTTPGLLAPIARIGGGEVRVDHAASSNTAAWDDEADTGSLSFGFHTVADQVSVTRQVRVQNYSAAARTYSITHGFRYANDAASGAVSLSHPASIEVPADSSRTFDVTLKVDGENLPAWTLDGGRNGGEGHLLQTVELDGYLNIDGGGDNVHLAWQVLPRRSADVDADRTSVDVGGSFELENDSMIQDGPVEVFSLLGTSRRFPAGLLPGPGSNYAVIDLKEVGVRYIDVPAPATDVLQFGISTHGKRAHPSYPAEFDIFLNTDDGPGDEYVIFNLESGGAAVTGQTVVAIQKLGPPPCAPFAANAAGTACLARVVAFMDADLNSGNAIMTIPLTIGGTEIISPGAQITADVLAADNYFTGEVTDSVEDLTFTPNKPKYVVSGGPSLTVPAGGKVALTVSAVPGGDAATPSQTGFLFLERLAKHPDETDIVLVGTGGGGDEEDDGGGND